jgi:hypothetical protein
VYVLQVPFTITSLPLKKEQWSLLSREKQWSLFFNKTVEPAFKRKAVEPARYAVEPVLQNTVEPAFKRKAVEPASKPKAVEPACKQAVEMHGWHPSMSQIPTILRMQKHPLNATMQTLDQLHPFFYRPRVRHEW